jgi:hypothetical protein
MQLKTRGQSTMANKTIEPDQLDDLAAMAGLSIREANKTQVAALLKSTREAVIRRANVLPIEAPPALSFDSR